jgi:hypothetical protein
VGKPSAVQALGFGVAWHTRAAAEDWALHTESVSRLPSLRWTVRL